ncbi:MAG TPA: hypothetical protein VN522_09115 [Solirubrobacterales bacterium]|nr:hypothetical protein [Solirubrobacterales bacterium]
MKSLNRRAPRIAGLLALALGAVALLAVSGIAAAKDHGRDDGGHHGRHHDHGRHHHLREAGTISSFDASTGKLTIALSGGGTVTGLVNKGTEIKCEGVDDRRDRRNGGDNSGPGSGDDNGGQSEPGDDHGGRGEPEPGDDNGGRGEPEPGDDNGGETPPVGAPAGGASCSVASLVPGAFVSEAEWHGGRGTAVFEEIELGHHS